MSIPSRPVRRLVVVVFSLSWLCVAAPVASAQQRDLVWRPPGDAVAHTESGPLSWPEAAAQLPTRALTIAAWVRVDAFPEWSGIFSALQDNGSFEQGVMLGLRGNRFAFGLATRGGATDADGTMTYLEANRLAVAGEWAFVCAVYDGAMMRLYVDGEVVGTSTAQKGDVWYPDDLRVAVNAYVDSNETHPLQGALAEVGLSASAWSVEKIARTMRETRREFPKALLREPVWEGITPLADSEMVQPSARVRVATGQFVQPAGRGYAWRGRPVDVVVSPSGDLVAVKDNGGVGLFAVGARGGSPGGAFVPLQYLAFPTGGGSMHGVVFARDGKRLWATTAQNTLFEASSSGSPRAAWTWSRFVTLPGPGGAGAAHATGIAELPDGDRLLVCLSRNNTLAEVDLSLGKVVREIPVGVAPYDVVVLEGGERAIVSNWGGRRPRDGERSAPSSGTPVLVDERGVASSGTVGLVDLGRDGSGRGAMVREVATGLHPSDLLLDPVRDRVYVANANSDTVTVLAAAALEEVATLLARPDPDLPYGSATNALALTDGGRTLLAANGGNNALAVFRRADPSTDLWEPAGYVPTGWYPGGVAASGDGSIYVASVKGLGSRSDDATSKRSVYAYTGVASAIDWPPSDDLLADWTERVRADVRTAAALRATARRDAARDGVEPVPVPARVGEPSTIRHVVYVIKENRTYDQVLGDLPQGNGDPALCIFPRRITPNHHALAEQFVLLDNFYCNGVNSADGHSWATEGNVTDHLEKSFGGFTRSYTFGDDPLTYSSTGFVWDGVLLAGLSFRNYGEMDYAEPVPASSFEAIYKDWKSGAGKIGFAKKIGIDTLARHTCPDYPGWNMKIPDVLRADRFLAELARAEASGTWYDFMIVYLPQDHTSGLSRGMPTPAAHMADNDLALGRIVEGISKSRFWPETCVFVIEDDPQNGFDHVDGHRSLCFVASPWTRRGAVVHEFFNQTSVLHTMQRILGLPPRNQIDAASPLMTPCFADTPDPTPYVALEPDTPLDQLNASAADVGEGMRKWYVATAGEDFAGFDRADEDTLNRILWHAMKGAVSDYPAHLAGAHGTGLPALGLVRTRDGDDDEDEDEDGDEDRGGDDEPCAGLDSSARRRE